MGSGQSVTLAPESELFLGYMSYGPTLGRTGTNKAHLIKYSLGYDVDGQGVHISLMHGETNSLAITIDDASDNGDATITIDSNTNVKVGMSVTGTSIPLNTTVLTVNSATEIVLSQSPSLALADGAELTLTTNANHFTDFYHLVPDLYTGCTAEFYYTESSSIEATLRFTATVAGNDADAIYFAGNILDYPNLHSHEDSGVGTGKERGYIILQANGSTIPAPISLEERVTVTSFSAGGETVDGSAGVFNNVISTDDLIYEEGGGLVGKVWSSAANGTLVASRTEPTSSTTHLHFLSSSITTAGAASTVSHGTLTLTTNGSLTGILTAGDFVSIHANTPASATVLGKVISLSADGKTILLHQSGGSSASDTHEIYWGKDTTSASSDTKIYTVSPRVLSNNWIGLTNNVGIPQVEVETKQVNLALAGSRNYSYQYRGMETAGAASLDINLNHGSWLHYAFGSLSSVSLSHTDKTHVSAFKCVDAKDTNKHNTYAGFNTGADRDTSGHTANGKFHRVLKGTEALCPPLLPNTGAGLLTNPSTNDGVLLNGITYNFSERNDNKLPSFGLELLVQKGSALDGTGKSLMVDRNTYSENVFAQIYPGCVVSDMQLTANENEELKATLNLNVKRVFEAPAGYVGKCYDATNNDTSEFKNLLNFGQQTGRGTTVNSDLDQSFIDPFFFSNGTISLFGQEFLKVGSFTMSLQNTLTDKRYIGQYNRQIKDYVPGLRTYELTLQAMVTDRRIFDELRRLSPHRFTLGEGDDGSNAKIELLFTKSNGESIKLEFDDYMVSAATWPIQDDRGPVMVDFTIMPLRVGSLFATTHWVMQS